MPMSSTVRLLHLTDRTSAALGSYFADRGLRVDTCSAADRPAGLGRDGAAYTHIVVEGVLPAADLDDLRRRWPSAVVVGWRDDVPFLPDERLAAIREQTGGKDRRRRDWVFCAVPPEPDAAAAALARFHHAVNSLGKGRPDWRFLVPAHDPACDPPDCSRRVKVLEPGDTLLGVCALARAVAVLAPPPPAFVATLLEAVACKAWVLTTPDVVRTLPAELRPYCAALDLEAPDAFDEALDRVVRKEWPEGDPNGDLRRRAFEALDRALSGNDDQPAPAVASAGPALQATFCTVVTPLHTRVAQHNVEIVTALNEGCGIRWNVVNNHVVRLNDKWSAGLQRELRRAQRLQQARAAGEDSGASTAGTGPAEADLSALFPGADIYSGLTPEQAFDYFAADLRSTSDDDEEHRRLLSKYLASYHHASGLNIALEHVRTRYAVVIDPDLYVIRPGWLREVIAWMDAHGLAVFGTPWNPRWYQKFRYFPCSHLMVIDLQKYPFRRDMLMPDLVRPGVKYVSTFWLDYMRAAGGSRRSRGQLLRHAVHALREDARQRATIEMSRDTGFRMLEDFRRRQDLRAGTAQPVWTPDEEFQPPAVSRLQRWLDRFLPDRWSYTPKRPDYASAKSFTAFGYPDCRSLGWEEFVWKGEPFAFHVRGELQRQSVGATDDVEVWNRLNGILRRLGRQGIADNVVAGRS